jgi:hypothetical protein
MTKSATLQRKMAMILMLAVCSSTLLPVSIAYGAETETAAAKPITAPCAVRMIDRSTNEQTEYSIVYSVRNGTKATDAVRIRCLGFQKPAENKDNKVACVVWACNEAGEDCFRANRALSSTELTNAGDIISRGPHNKYVSTEDKIVSNLAPVSVACKYQMLGGLSRDAKTKLTQSLLTLGPRGTLFGSDSLGNAFGDAGSQSPPAADSGTPAPPVSSNTAVPAVPVPAGSVALQSKWDPNEVVIEIKGGNQVYPMESTFTPKAQSSDTPAPPKTWEEMTAREKSGRVAGTALFLFGGAVFITAGASLLVEGLILGGVGGIAIGTGLAGNGVYGLIEPAKFALKWLGVSK